MKYSQKLSSKYNVEVLTFDGTSITTDLPA